MHRIAAYIFGTIGGTIDGVSFWTAVSAIMTYECNICGCRFEVEED